MTADLGPRTSSLLLAVSLAVLTTTAACSMPGDSGAQRTADRLAEALSAGDVGDVSFLGDDTRADRQFRRISGDAPSAKVHVVAVRDKDTTATATLGWSRPVGSRTWTYQTNVRLVRQSGSWVVRWDPRLVEPSLEDGEVLDTVSVTPERGRILAGDGTALVKPRPVLRVGLDKSGLAPKAAAQSAGALAELVDVSPGPFRRQVKASGDQAFVQAIVYRRKEAPDGVLGRLQGIKGARAISDHLPLAPTKDFGDGLLGSVGPATAELVKKSHGRIRAGDVVGVSGLEARYDEQLFGRRGETVDAVDDHGNRRTLFRADPTPGKDLSTTLDPRLQGLAEKLLGRVGPASALVAMEASSGKLLAVANGPGSKGYATATYGRYAPGSTFKIVSTLALLRAGLKPGSQVDCPATTVVDGKRFKNYSDYPSGALGRIRLVDALVNSCNTAFVGEHEEVKARDLAAAAAALGFGIDHDLGFPAYFGQVGEPSSETQLAASLIGQGTVLASPMSMATVMASVLSGGSVLPVLLPDEEVEKKQPADPLTEDEARRLRSMLGQVVDRGSGTVLRGLPGPPVIAKTGTAEFGDKPPLPTHAWMVAGQGDLAVAVFVDKGDSGSGTAGPILRSFLEGARASS